MGLNPDYLLRSFLLYVFQEHQEVASQLLPSFWDVTMDMYFMKEMLLCWAITPLLIQILNLKLGNRINKSLWRYEISILISDKSIWKNQVRRIKSLVYFNLIFYYLCSLQKSISKMIFADYTGSENKVRWTWFFQIDFSEIKYRPPVCQKWWKLIAVCLTQKRKSKLHCFVSIEILENEIQP